MYTGYTYQDWLTMGGGAENARTIVNNYKGSDDFLLGVDANRYFAGENPSLDSKFLLKLDSHIETDAETGEKRKVRDRVKIEGNRIASNFLRRFVCQQNQFLLGNGVQLDDDAKKTQLGIGFDKALEAIGERAILHGVAYGFWNLDHLEVMPAVKDGLSGCVALLDEMTGEPMTVLQFWQLSSSRPMYVRCFEPDGVTLWFYDKDGDHIAEPKRAYKHKIRTDMMGARVIGVENWSALPVIPLYANNEHESELTASIRSKINAYDRIMSDYGDNLDRANDVYWVLNNFGGSADDALQIVQDIQALKVAMTISDGAGTSSAEPHTIDVPYAARQTALTILQKELYADFMALNMDELTGGSLTNVAIETAMTNLNLKCDRFEWQCFQFVQKVLALIGVQTEAISFTRQQIVNRPETVAAIMQMRSDIDIRTALKLNPYIPDDSIDEIIANMDAEQTSGLSSMEELEQMLQDERETGKNAHNRRSEDEDEEEPA